MVEHSPTAPSLPQFWQQSALAQPFDPVFIEFGNKEINQSIAERFEAVVDRHAERIAIKTKEEVLSYRLLNERANRIGRAILAMRVPDGEPVVLLLDKGVAVIAAMLGTLKAGKVYMPLDPSFPRERLASVLEQSKAGLIIADNQNIGLARAFEGRHTLNIDEISSHGLASNIGLPASPDSLALIIYTSGSTGEPKGVAHTHRVVLHNVMNVTNALRISWADRATLLASCSTAQALTDMYAALLNGATLYPWNTKEDGLVGLPVWMMQEEISLYRSSTSVFRSLAEILRERDAFPRLRIVKLGSEPVLSRDVEQFKRHFSQHCVLVNALSITEALTVCLHQIDRNTVVTGESLTVGRPVNDKEIVLVDDAGQEVEVNQVGEITVRSQYLSAGYWQRPDITKLFFRTGPEGAHKRIYHTGDMGRIHTDGTLEYLGRRDSRVKIRGYTVDMSEIEKTLLDHRLIKQAAVIARDDRPPFRYLAAYVAPHSQTTLSVVDVRRFLEERLPHYMIPTVTAVLETLPFSASGKVDYRALPSPIYKIQTFEKGSVTTQTAIEESVAAVWARVLGLQRVGVTDNFFDLGGHSLLATQIVSRVQALLDVDVAVSTLIANPTIAEWSAVIEKAKSKTG